MAGSVLTRVETGLAPSAEALKKQIAASKIKHVKQIANGWTVQRHVRISERRNRIGEVVTAALSQRLQSPVPLNKLRDRNVVIVSVNNFATLGIRRNHQQWNARSIAKEIHGLRIAGVIVPAAFVEGHDDGGIL